MPWHIGKHKDCNGYAVIKDDDGSLVGCHGDDLAKAKRQLTALYMSEKDRKEQMKMVRGVYYPQEDFAVVRNPNEPATWAILLADGKRNYYTAKSLNRAASFLIPGTDFFRILKLSPEEINTAKRRIRAEFAKLSVPPESLPQSVRKSSDQRWLLVYSNNYIDDDYPADILSERSHKAFSLLVKSGVVDYPELWFAHLPGTSLGKADFIGYENGFAIAAGYVYEGSENKLAKMDETYGVSHTMPIHLRNYGDPRVIDFYISSELSVLPRKKAANKSTGILMKGDIMNLSDEMREELAKIGYGEAEVAQIDDLLTKYQDEVGNRESKEASEANVEDGEPSIDVSEGAIQPVEPEETLVTGSQIEELAKAQMAAMTELAKSIADLNQRFDTLQEQFGSLSKQQNVQSATMAKWTPQVSFTDMFSALPINSVETVVDGRTELAKSKPQETEKPAAPITGISFLDSFLRDEK